MKNVTVMVVSKNGCLQKMKGHPVTINLVNHQFVCNHIDFEQFV
jgi:hypothetical protein